MIKAEAPDSIPTVTSYRPRLHRPGLRQRGSDRLRPCCRHMAKTIIMGGGKQRRYAPTPCIPLCPGKKARGVGPFPLHFSPPPPAMLDSAMCEGAHPCDPNLKFASHRLHPHQPGTHTRRLGNSRHLGLVHPRYPIPRFPSHLLHPHRPALRRRPSQLRWPLLKGPALTSDSDARQPSTTSTSTRNTHTEVGQVQTVIPVLFDPKARKSSPAPSSAGNTKTEIKTIETVLFKGPILRSDSDARQSSTASTLTGATKTEIRLIETVLLKGPDLHSDSDVRQSSASSIAQVENSEFSLQRQKSSRL